MSIVLEALEKAQKEARKAEETPRVSVKEPEQIEPAKKNSLPKRRKPFRRHSIYFLVIFLFIAILGLGFFNWWLSHDETMVPLKDTPLPEVKELDVVDTVSISQPSAMQVIPKEDGVFHEERRPALVVKGIVWDPYEPVAIINGRFFTIGDEILGAIVKEIFFDRVRFQYKEEEFIVVVQQ